MTAGASDTGWPNTGVLLLDASCLLNLCATDRLSTRETVQNLTHSFHLLHEGDLMSIPIDPSSRVMGT